MGDQAVVPWSASYFYHDFFFLVPLFSRLNKRGNMYSPREFPKWIFYSADDFQNEQVKEQMNEWIG